jgi:hypothetical protein
LKKKATALLCTHLLAMQNLSAWGVRGHTLANLAAVESIPLSGPAILKAQKAYIGHLGTIPDTWRSPSEPFLRISEDANHSWYTEGFDFIPNPPRSRTEFILRVHDEYLRVSKSDPNRAKLLQHPLHRAPGLLSHRSARRLQEQGRPGSPRVHLQTYCCRRRFPARSGLHGVDR